MKITLLTIVVILIGLMPSGCATNPPTTKAPTLRPTFSVTVSVSDPQKEVSITDLVSDPERHNGQTVITEGIYIDGFEFRVLADKVVLIGSGDSREIHTDGPAFIWFAGAIPPDIRDTLNKSFNPGSGTVSYGKVKVTGRFDYGGRYGNLGGYRYQIAVSKVELLTWILPG